MQESRSFRTRRMSPQARPGADFTAPADSTIRYPGAVVEVHCAVCAVCAACAACAAGAGRA